MLKLRAGIPDPAPLGRAKPPIAPVVSSSPSSSPTDYTKKDLVRPRYQPPSWTWKHLVLASASLAALSALVVGFIIIRDWLLTSPPTSPTGMQTITGKMRNLRNVEENVFRLSLPRKVWEPEKTFKSGLKAIEAMQRSQPDVWLAVAAKDYGQRQPRDAELVKEAMDRLYGLFGDTRELGAAVEPGELAGLPAQSLEFRGEINQVVWRGRCFMLRRNGIGYWFFLAGPSLKEVKQEWTSLEEAKSFSLIQERRGWSEQPPKMDTFTAPKLPLSLKAPEGVWEKFNAIDEDERGELFLLGRYLKEKDNRKNAFVLVTAQGKLIDPRKGMKTARGHVEEKIREENKEYQIAPVDDKAEAEEKAIGNQKGWVQEFRVHVREEPRRYLLLAVLAEAEPFLMIRCECAWESRQIWRQDFLDLLGTLRWGRD